MSEHELDLFTFTAPYQPHSDTSRAAAAEIIPKAPAMRVRVLKFLQERGPIGATDEEIQIALGMNPSTERPRRIELQEQGLCVDSERTRKTTSGRNATVWVAGNV